MQAFGACDNGSNPFRTVMQTKPNYEEKEVEVKVDRDGVYSAWKDVYAKNTYSNTPHFKEWGMKMSNAFNKAYRKNTWKK